MRRLSHFKVILVIGYADHRWEDTVQSVFSFDQHQAMHEAEKLRAEDTDGSIVFVHATHAEKAR